MSQSQFRHVKIRGVNVVLPKDYIDIDSELEYFDNNLKRLARQKKMIGFGRRFIVDGKTTITDMAVDAVLKLRDSLGLDLQKVDALFVVDHTPDFLGPCDACVLHGKLGLRKGIPAFDVNIGCSGYIYGLWLAHTMIEARAVKNCLLVAGDLATLGTKQSNRKRAPLFSDSVSATFIEYTEDERLSSFVLGTDGSRWDTIVKPVGGSRFPFTRESFELTSRDCDGNEWTVEQEIMAGEEVFGFTMEVVPQLISDTLLLAGVDKSAIDMFAIHQANRQIVEMIASKAALPVEKVPMDVFSRYANTTVNSALSVVCDQNVDLRRNRVAMFSFGAGLSWGGVVLDLEDAVIGGVTTYVPRDEKYQVSRQIEFWLHKFSGDYA